ncbi:guanylate kinase [Helcobacillus massiliensis]|uniref:guanylate kinase n=1 Tax=Helcobacillus TaxID=1161125 RepID=UPI001EF4371C|nr:guanylate kinase [Helcobacillus massiliensis]MCG7426449.1 guanylate kinase [Helcobacillus sp. ACRRO]MCT1556970.1 guanylate kinase [Helcobacillus massiliensis]MCT2035359.1 guanylate kinase [Helcobacillus massiliensis]MCT2331426.1 guanylate kinase [Helcobacillus massiliensis]MDK7741040.1 guanylate kinase [Helcobacillus massiliensis]
MTVLAGPTAVGKGTVVNRLLEKQPNLHLSVSATTRPPRPGEKDGEHYHFVSEDEFTSLVDAGDMLEWAIVHGKHRYGTPRGPVVEQLQAGRPVLLEIDLAGARQVRASMPEAQFVFLAPPSREELVRRLIGRGTETAEERERRLLTAETEMAAEKEFDLTIVNDDLDRAVEELARVIGVGDVTAA